MSTRKRVKRSRKRNSKKTRGGSGKMPRAPGAKARLNKLSGLPNSIVRPFKKFVETIEQTPVYLILCHGTYMNNYRSVERPDRELTDKEKAIGAPAFTLSDSTYVLNLSDGNEVTNVSEPLYHAIMDSQEDDNFRNILFVLDKYNDTERKPNAENIIESEYEGRQAISRLNRAITDENGRYFISTLNRATDCIYPNQICCFYDTQVNRDKNPPKNELVDTQMWGVFPLDLLENRINRLIEVAKIPEPTTSQIFKNEEFSIIHSEEKLGPMGNGQWCLDEIINYVYTVTKNPKGIFVLATCSGMEGFYNFGKGIQTVQTLIRDADLEYKSKMPLLTKDKLEKKYIPHDDFYPHFRELTSDENYDMDNVNAAASLRNAVALANKK